MAEERQLLAEPPGPVSSDLVPESGKQLHEKEGALVLGNCTVKYGRFWKAGPGPASSANGLQLCSPSFSTGAQTHL